MMDNRSVLASECHLNSSWASVESGFSVTREVLTDYVALAVWVFGILGNLAAVVVLRRLPARATVTLLTALSATDMSFLVLEICLTHTHRLLCIDASLLWSLLVHSRMASVWLVVMLSLERYIVVCHPLQVHSVCTIGNAKRAIRVIIVLSGLYMSVDFIHVLVLIISNNPQTVGFIHRTLYFIVYRSVLDPMCLFLLPFGILFVLNTKLIKSISRAHREHSLLFQERRNSSRMAQGQQLVQLKPKASTTVNIVAVVSVFLLTQPIVLVTNMWELDHLYWGHVLFSYDNSVNVFYNVISPIALCLLSVPSAVNFIIYTVFYTKFRDNIRLKICRRSRGKCLGEQEEHITAV